MSRVLTALVLLPIFTYTVLWAPRWWFLAVVAAVALLCYREFGRIAGQHGIYTHALLGSGAGLLVLFVSFRELTLVTLIALVALAIGMRRDPLKTLPQSAVTVLGVLYAFGTLRSAIAIREFSPAWLFLALSLNWVGDIAAYYVGRAIGKHKLAPAVSPGKSLEGAVASVLFAMAYSGVYARYLLPGVALWSVLLIAMLANIAGQIGDLSESAMKRGAGMKDSGTLLPGHGGWLDRLDSSLFALPVVHWFLPG